MNPCRGAARAQMTMRADVERDGTATTNSYGLPDPPSWATEISGMPCRVWTERRQLTRDGDKIAVIEETKVMFSLSQSVQEGDRLASVVDRQGTTLWDGPLYIRAIVRRPTHYEATLRDVSG